MCFVRPTFWVAVQGLYSDTVRKYSSLMFQLFIWEFRVYRKVLVVRFILYMCVCHEHAYVCLQGISFEELCKYLV